MIEAWQTIIEIAPGVVQIEDGVVDVRLSELMQRRAGASHLIKYSDRPSLVCAEGAFSRMRCMRVISCANPVAMLC